MMEVVKIVIGGDDNNDCSDDADGMMVVTLWFVLLKVMIEMVMI